MTHLGILLIFDHFPRVSTDARGLDAQLRRYLAHHGWHVSAISVIDAVEKLPDTIPDCEPWIVSGTPALLPAGHLDRLRRLLREMVVQKTLIGMNHGEHLLHDALAAPGAIPPPTPRAARMVRNPFRSFWNRDRLFAAGPSGMTALARPDSEAGFFGFCRRAA